MPGCLLESTALFPLYFYVVIFLSLPEILHFCCSQLLVNFTPKPVLQMQLDYLCIDLCTLQYSKDCEYYLTNGTMMQEDRLDLLRPCDAIYLGAVGFPGVPDHISLGGYYYQFDEHSGNISIFDQ